MSNFLKKSLPYIFVGLLVLGIEWAFGWGRLLAPWTKVPIGELVVAIVLLFASYIFRAWRVADHFDLKGRFEAVLTLTLQHNLWNNLLPMRAGELSFPILMRQRFGLDPAHALAGLFWIRLVDAQVLAALALGSLLWMAKVKALALALVALALLAPFVFWSLRGWLARWVNRASGFNAADLPHASPSPRPSPSGRGGRVVAVIVGKVLAGLPRDAGHFTRGVVLTWANWLVKLAALAWVLRQFLPVEWLRAGLAVLGGEATSVLPIHAPGGFGTYEAGMLAVLLAQGTALEAATAVAINTHLFLLGSSLLFGLAAMLIPGKSANMPTCTKNQNML